MRLGSAIPNVSFPATFGAPDYGHYIEPPLARGCSLVRATVSDMQAFYERCGALKWVVTTLKEVLRDA